MVSVWRSGQGSSRVWCQSSNQEARVWCQSNNQEARVHPGYGVSLTIRGPSYQTSYDILTLRCNFRSAINM
ncbi:hypothetical protein DPMN_036660 [Dreissena polymorpha]|uniref:Uncharacterized protein n=1 Tax=Dreissena polymorpha TaxID=45954 RepID=A0A9D4M9U4_DREPO|nr:hypothetical protein DPMN_036660 [Dreissena polymorpha]